MINYIKAELYRIFNRAYFWAVTAIVAIMLLSFNIILNINNMLDLTNLFQMVNHMLIIPVYLIVMFIDMTVCEEYKNNTLKNVINFGFSRNKLILSKFIVGVILSFISAFIILFIFYGSALIMGSAGSNLKLSLLDNLTRIAFSLPLWIAAISVGIFLNTIINNTNAFSFVYIFVFMGIAPIIKLFSVLVSPKFQCVYNILITTQLKAFGSTVKNGNFILAVITGCIYTVIFVVLSMMIFKKKEIK
jgi:ABC-2 type transport system permease protein